MSKLSLHISDWLNPDLTFEYIERTRPPLLKVFDVGGIDDNKIREAKRLSPATVFVGRVYFPDQRIERDERTPVDTVLNYDPISDARTAFAQMQDAINKTRGLINVWEGYNEIPIDTNADIGEREKQKARNYSAFTVEMARLMHETNLKYAAYSFSTGNPVHVELWDLLVPGLRASDYLALHEYIAPDENWQNFNSGMLNKYRAAYARIPADARKPILITECGADFNGQQGYKGKISPQRYLEMMADYDRQLMNDPHVLGATIFCYGINAPQWKTYDIGGDFTKLLAQHMLANPTPPMEAPVVVEPPKPTPAQPIQPAQPTAAPQAGVLLLDKARWFAEEATRKLEAKDGAAAHAILVDTLIPWFYATAREHSTDLANAQAQTTARWFCEESARRIEANDLDGAHKALQDSVLAWLASPGPKALGILSVEVSKPRKSSTRRGGKKKSVKAGAMVLSVDSTAPAKPKTQSKRKPAPKSKPTS